MPRRSPRTRGWSYLGQLWHSTGQAFPAYAGVVPCARPGCGRRRGVPRVRGGGPRSPPLTPVPLTRSPRTRGWSVVVVPRRRWADAFPAYAGVVPCSACLGLSLWRVPRVRGGGPVELAERRAVLLRSPRTRGWSRQELWCAARSGAFPAYAGVVPTPSTTGTSCPRVPRVRGGGPSGPPCCLCFVPRSPRTRGWSHRLRNEETRDRAFPAYAGVVPRQHDVGASHARVPRVRGGGPANGRLHGRRQARSPRTRGWSLGDRHGRPDVEAFPAYAGVVPDQRTRRTVGEGVPRVRGGGPQADWLVSRANTRSPRTRGWSQGGSELVQQTRAFPAYAGVVPPCASSGGRSWSVPRVREGGPATSRRICTARSRSPRTRGWSPDLIPTTHHGPAFPAYAGVVPSSWCPRWPRARVPRVRGGGPGIALRPGGRPSRSPRTRGWSLDGFWNTEVDACVPRVRGGGPVCWPSGGPLTTRSPRTRGWSLQQCDRLSHGNAFPAYAGVVPASVGHRLRSSGVPRVRGGGPMIRSSRTVAGTRSPRTRGWSHHRRPQAGVHLAFPAYAGVVPTRPCRGPTCSRVPRVRGGGPAIAQSVAVLRVRSPRTRGWSRDVYDYIAGQVAFPAYAGVVRPGTRAQNKDPGVPRVRGGGPPSGAPPLPRRPRSPRTRGWSPGRLQLGRVPHAFPAYAGVVPARQTSSAWTGWRSPRTRGWSPNATREDQRPDAFPAYAGVVPRRQRLGRSRAWVPRVRGGGPGGPGP